MAQGIFEAFRQFHRFHLICCRFRRRHVRSLFSLWLSRLCRLFLAALMQDMFLVPRHSSKDLWNLFLSFWSFLFSDTHSDLFTHFFWGVSAFFHNPFISTSSFETSSSLSSKKIFAAAAPCLPFLLVFCTDSFRFTVTLRADCVILVLDLNWLLRGHVALGTGCDFRRWKARANIQTSHVVCQNTMSRTFFTNHSHVVRFALHRVVTGFSFAASVFASAWWTSGSVSLVSVSATAFSVRTTAFFSFSFLSFSFRRLCGTYILILFQMGFCGCGFLFALFFEFLTSFF